MALLINNESVVDGLSSASLVTSFLSSSNLLRPHSWSRFCWPCSSVSGLATDSSPRRECRSRGHSCCPPGCNSAACIRHHTCSDSLVVQRVFLPAGSCPSPSMLLLVILYLYFQRSLCLSASRQSHFSCFVYRGHLVRRPRLSRRPRGPHPARSVSPHEAGLLLITKHAQVAYCWSSFAQAVVCVCPPHAAVRCVACVVSDEICWNALCTPVRTKSWHLLPTRSKLPLGVKSNNLILRRSLEQATARSQQLAVAHRAPMLLPNRVCHCPCAHPPWLQCYAIQCSP